MEKALEDVLKQFPSFACVMRKGFFWNYMEDLPAKAQVQEEYRPPCSQMYVHDQKNLLFQVTYYKNRINLETYHALTDGTGAMIFLKTLVYEYLRLAHPMEVSGNTEERLGLDATEDEKTEDGFLKYYVPDREKMKIPKYKAYQLPYRKMEHGSFRLTEGRASTKAVLEAARRHQTTMTVFLTAVYLMAVARDMSPRQRKRPVALMVPVNLRSYFPSHTMRNFFGWFDIGYTFTGQESLDQVIRFVAEFFKRELTAERIGERMSKLMDFERNFLVRILPLELKTIAMQIGAAATTGEVTAIFSNIGRVQMPSECTPFIQRFSFFTTTPKAELCLCSWEDELIFGFTSAYTNERLEKNFFGILEEQGISVSLLDKEDRYPDTAKEKKIVHKSFQWFTFICVAVAVVANVLNWVAFPSSWWGKYVLVGAACAWLVTGTGLAKRRNPLKNAVWQMILLSVLLILWDLLTGWKGWSVNYGVPLVITATMIFLTVITALLHLTSESYMIYFLMTCLAGLVPWILAMVEILPVKVPAAVSGTVSILILAALVIFQRQAVIEELKKKFHF